MMSRHRLRLACGRLGTAALFNCALPQAFLFTVLQILVSCYGAVYGCLMVMGSPWEMIFNLPFFPLFAL